MGRIMLHLNAFILLLTTLLTVASATYTKTTKYNLDSSRIAGGYLIEEYRDEADVCDSILMFPGQNMVWNRYILGTLYFFGMMWCFLGVAIIADLFMAAIEVITSKEVVKETKLPSGEVEKVTTLVWNPTIANLSLMALGSSAPEIFLALIGAMRDLNTTNVDELGPGTIVGSAAFNLLVITGICVIAIPDGDGRHFGALNVFYVTAFASIFAYVWLYIVVAWSTPDIVTVWEAVLTFLFFPVLLAGAYCADKSYFCFVKLEYAETHFRDDDTDEFGGQELMESGIAGLGTQKLVAIDVKRPSLKLTADKEEIRNFVKEMRRNGPIDDLETVALAEASRGEINKPTSRNKYRINATKMLSGKPSSIPSDAKLERERKALHKANTGLNPLIEEGPPKIIFRTTKYAVLESIGTLRVPLIRTGDPNIPVTVRVRTKDGTATADDNDYEHFDREIVFSEGVNEQIIDVTINDDDKPEDDEEFYIELMDTLVNQSKNDFTSMVGDMNLCTIEIIDDDNPGTLAFEYIEYVTAESKRELTDNIIRRNGAKGVVSCKLALIDDTAVANINYTPIPSNMTIRFENQETHKPFAVKLIDTGALEPLDVAFKARLSEPTGGATLTSKKLAMCRITNDSELATTIERVKIIMESRAKVLSVETESWAEQFMDACTISGELDEVTGKEERPPMSAYVLHFLSIFWKVLFAVVPPTRYYGGWAAFTVAVIMIGILTAVVGDLAALFGCAVGLKPGITAITFVALGTSLPDTFASAAAAKGEDTADAAVGNVTGSNAVNVFLGLGLPWLLSSIYWSARGERSCDLEGGKCPDLIGNTQGFYLPAGDLAFSVMVFICLAVSSLIILLIRNAYCDGALGGNKYFKAPTAYLFVLFWLTYIILASLKAEKYFN